MNIGIMRFVDYWLGLPLCFLLTRANFILRSVGFKAKEENDPPKIAFIKLSELGAIILSHPFLKRVKEESPFADLFFVTFEKNKDIFRLLGGIIPDKNILLIREDNALSLVLDAFRTMKRLRREKIDIIFDLEFFSRFSVILAYLINAPKRIGFYRYTFEGLYRGDLLTHKVQYNPLNHVSITYLSLSQVFKEESKNTPELNADINKNKIDFPKYTPQSGVAERLIGKLGGIRINGAGRLFLLNPGEGVLPIREWPLENFITLSAKLLENKDNHIIIIGTQGAAEKGEALLEAVNNPRCASLIGQTSLGELLELFCRADALIANDCGLAHLAMLAPLYKFIIFGPESPQIFAPLGENNRIIFSGLPCSPCLSVLNHRNSTCNDNKCLKSIKPEDVYEMVAKSLLK